MISSRDEFSRYAAVGTVSREEEVVAFAERYDKLFQCCEHRGHMERKAV
jgi:hypothetical protein